MLALLAVALFAQKSNDRNDQRSKPEPVTVAGKLALVNGYIAVQSQDAVYYVMGIQRLIGFVDGLKEGAQVSLEGYVRNVGKENAKVITASKLTIAGRSYDLAPADRLFEPSRQDYPENRRNAKPDWGRNAPRSRQFFNGRRGMYGPYNGLAPYGWQHKGRRLNQDGPCR